jgi:carbonic anhydrase/acetyltransferase-like protein (isoleucine patch superfamily)
VLAESANAPPDAPEVSVIAPFRGKSPEIDPSAYLTASAIVIGDVEVGAETSIWFHAIVRGDLFPIRIGARTNVQDHATIHVLGGRAAATIGDDVTIGHGAIVHGCTIGNRTLVGMGAIVLDGVEVGDECLIGAGAVVTPGTRIAAGQLVLGSPGRPVRPLSDAERASLLTSALNYARVAAEYRAAGVH